MTLKGQVQTGWYWASLGATLQHHPWPQCHESMFHDAHTVVPEASLGIGPPASVSFQVLHLVTSTPISSISRLGISNSPRSPVVCGLFALWVGFRYREVNRDEPIEWRQVA